MKPKIGFLAFLVVLLLVPSLAFGATFGLTVNKNEANQIGAGKDGVIGSFIATGTLDGKVVKIVLDAKATTIGGLTMETDDIASVSVWVDVNQNGVLERDIDTVVATDATGVFGSLIGSVSAKAAAVVTMTLATDDQVAVANLQKVYFIVVITTAEVPQSADKVGIIDVDVTLTDAASATEQINANGAAWTNDVLNFAATKLSFVNRDTAYRDVTGAVGDEILLVGSTDLLHAVDNWGNVDVDFEEKVRFLLYQYENGDRIVSNFTATSNADDDITWDLLANEVGNDWTKSLPMIAGVLQENTAGVADMVKSIKYSPPDGLEDNLVLVARTQVSELEGSVTLRNGAAHEALTGVAPDRGIEIYDVNFDGHIDHATIFFNAPVATTGTITIANFEIKLAFD